MFPHLLIGLLTVTYLFEGEIMHRDSLGSEQPIRRRALSWMTVGQGITHSERTASGLRGHSNRLFGIQSWAALPAALEDTAPGFAHHPAEALPVIEADGARLLLLGSTVVDAPRYIFSNFASSRRERIEQAKADWMAGRFTKVTGGDKEFIPISFFRSIILGL